METIRAYYQHQLQYVDHIDCESVDELSSFRHAKDNLEAEGRFMIYEQFFGGIAEEMETVPSDIYRKYSDDPWVLTAKPGLATLAREFEETKERMSADGSLEPYQERAINSYVALFDFAIERGYGVSYP